MDSEKLPGLIRLVVEQLVAHIHSEAMKDFIVSMSYVEVSGE